MIINYGSNQEKNHRKRIGNRLYKGITQNATDFVPLFRQRNITENTNKTSHYKYYSNIRPTLNKSDNEIQVFYADIKKALKLTEPHDLYVTQGDCNEKLGKGEAVNGVDRGDWYSFDK